MKSSIFVLIFGMLLKSLVIAGEVAYIVSNKNGTHFLAAGDEGAKCYEVKGNSEFQLQWDCSQAWLFARDEVFLSEDGELLVLLPKVVALAGKESNEIALMIFSKGKMIKVHKLGGLVDPKTDIDRQDAELQTAHVFAAARFSRWAEVRRVIQDDDFHARVARKGWGPDKELFWIETTRRKDIIIDPSVGDVVFIK